MRKFTIHHGEIGCEDVGALLALHFAAMQAHSPPDACHVLPISSLRDPSISVLTARENGRLVGVGALKALGPAEGEIKSMRTAPEALGTGVGGFLLGALIEEAVRRGYESLSLETGNSPPFAPALRLYERAGFRQCPAFGGYRSTPFTQFLRLELGPALHR